MLNHKKKIIYYLIESLFTLISCLYVYLLAKNYIALTPFDIQLLIPYVLILIILIWLLDPMLNRYFVFIYLFIYSIYLISQKIYNMAFHTYYRIGMALSLRNEVAGVGESIEEFLRFEYFVPLIFLVIFIIVFIILYFTLQRKVISFKEKIIQKLLVLVLIFPIKKSQNRYQILVDELKAGFDPFNSYTSKYNLYLTMNNNNAFVENFGLLPFLYKDTLSFFEKEVLSQEDIKVIDDYFNNKQTHKNNELTGIFKDKNVLFIQAESFMDVAVNEFLTPNLYILKEKGIEIVNFDTPATPGSTSDSEFAANMSIIPNSSEQAGCYLYENNKFPTTLPKLFKENGYVTSLYHNSFGTFYNRNNFMKKIGYDTLMFCDSFGENGDLPDKKVGETLSWIVNADYKYMGYWITFSGHQPYNYDSVGVDQNDVEKIKKIYPNLDESYVSYLAKQMDLDHAIGEILTILKQTNTLDNTVIVFFGDHIVKGLDFSSGSEFYKQTGLQYNNNDVHTSLYFYNSTIEPMKYEKVSTLIDLLPTIANMWDFKYDEKTILGRDIFDKDYNGFRYAEWGNWSTDDCYYDLAYDTYLIKDGSNAKIEDVKKEISGYLKMKDISKKILDLDYFKKGE